MARDGHKIDDKLEAAAKTLFFRFGVRRVSVDEICREARVSKMSFYRHFKDKDELAIRVLGAHFSGRMAALEKILAEDSPFEERLRRVLELKAEGFKAAGNEMVREVLTDRASPVGRFLGEIQQNQARRTREIFIELQRRGDIRRDIGVEVVLHAVEGIWRAFADEALLRLYPDKSRLYHELFQAVYHGVLPQRNRLQGDNPWKKKTR
jgi:AcrR family transcriptional regulator